MVLILVQNVHLRHPYCMKQLLLFLFLAFVQTTYGQKIKLQGCYTAKFLGSETIEFKGNDSFYFNGFYCTYAIRGKGTWKIRKNCLYLLFEKNNNPALTPATNCSSIHKTLNTDSTFTIDIVVLDKQHNPIPFARVVMQSGSHDTCSAITDTTGKTRLKSKSSTLPIKISISALGFEPECINIQEAANYNIQICQTQSSFEKIWYDGQVIVYKIDECTSDYILLRPKKSTGHLPKNSATPFYLTK